MVKRGPAENQAFSAQSKLKIRMKIHALFDGKTRTSACAARARASALVTTAAPDYVAPTSGTTKTPNKSLLIWLLVVPLVLNKQSLILRDPLRRLVGPVVSPHLSKPAGRVIESQY